MALAVMSMDMDIEIDDSDAFCEDWISKPLVVVAAVVVKLSANTKWEVIDNVYHLLLPPAQNNKPIYAPTTIISNVYCGSCSIGF